MNTHKRLRYFLTNTIFFITGYVQVLVMIFIVKCVTTTSFFIACAARWKSMIFLVLSSPETVHDPAQCKNCIFFIVS